MKLEALLPAVQSSGTLIEQADARTDQANLLAHEANARTDEANSRTDQAEKREQGMRASELSYRRLFETAKDGILILDAATGMIVDVNPFLQELLGYSHTELLSKKVWELGFLKDIFTNEVKFVELQELGYVRYENLPLETAHGQRIEVEFVSNVYLVNHQKVIQCNIRDISERRRLEEVQLSRNMLSNILDSIPQSVFWKDRRSVYLGCNGNYARIAGLTNPEEIVGKSDFDLPWPRQEAEPESADDREVVNGSQPKVHLVETLQQMDGTRPWIETTKLPLVDTTGRIFGLLGVLEDVSERKAMEISLTEALVTAEAGNRAKSDFLSIMSHELRTPLNGVLGCAELLTYTSLDEEQKSLANTVTRCGEHLLAIIKDILDFSSIEAGALNIQLAPIPVSESVELSALAVRPIAVAKGLTFRCEASPDVPNRIRGDALRIRQILINLLGNAVKFTSEGAVTLRIAPDKESGFLDFSVEDTGIGMSSATMGLLFMPFTQLDSTTTRAFGGTGLGLAISKRLAEAMGGLITVSSTVGEGSTFTLRLPLESLPACDGEAVPVSSHISDWGLNKRARLQEIAVGTKAPRESPGSKLVLVVEDDPENALTAGKMLKSLGYHAEFASNGVEALEACGEGKYHAILMDVVMPVMDGLEATRQIRGSESGSRVPIIALTANVMPGDRDHCIAAGMDDFLSKPFKRDELAAKLACAGDH